MTDKKYVDLFFYEFYTGLWKTVVSTQNNLHIRGATRVFVSQIAIPLPVTPEHLAWLANLGAQIKHKDDVTDRLEAPKDIVVSIPVERQFAL